MRVPRSWLRELVDIDVSSDELAIALSTHGAAVDKVERFAPGVSGIVAARVADVADVPESDKLVVAHADTGTDKVEVLAGAKNFREGDVVPLALPGARVTTLAEPVGVRPMIGGKYTSHGMLCSARELGVNDEHEGILVLDGSVPVGTDIAAYLGLDDDVLEFEIYPNRPDQMSVLGIAREVAVLYDVPLRQPDTTVIEDGPEASAGTSVEIEDRIGCPRYLARVIGGVTFGPSPALVQARLTACGFRPLGNLVDATNYVLLLTGQPLHAFDLDRLAEERIVVRRARASEEIATLDGELRKLDVDDLVIADAKDSQAIAGVMGGGESEVRDGTQRVLLESAYFDPVSVARTARRHRLRTEASARFERGADPMMVPDAASIAAELIRRWAGGTVARGSVDVGEAPQPKKLFLRPERIPAILGIDVEAEESERILRALGCDVDQDGRALAVAPPSWRPDLEREIDLIEELARIHGYEDIPSVSRPGVRGGRASKQLLRQRVRDTLLGAGLSEATLSSFAPSDDLAAIGYDGPLVEVSNPMTADQRRLRPSLFPGLLRAAQRNVAHGVGDVRLFEFGTIFTGWPDGSALPEQSEHVGFVIVGNLEPEHYSVERRRADAYDAKGIVELALESLGVTACDLDSDVASFFHPGRAANVVLDGVRIGRFGELRPSIAAAFDLDGAVVGGLALDAVLERAASTLETTPLPAHPPVLRDVAMAVDADARVGEIVETVRVAGGEILEHVRVVDVYQGEQVGEGRKSVAFRLTFRAPARTLTAAEADRARDAIASACHKEHGAEIR